MSMLMQNFQVGRVLVDDDDCRALFGVVVMAALPVLLITAFAISEETNAVDDQQLAAILL